MALSTMKLIAFGQVPFTTYHYLMVPTRSKQNMPAARLIYKPRDAERNLAEILYPLYMWKLIWYQGKNPFLPPQDTGSIYEALSKQKWVESSTMAANHKICLVCFVEGGFKGKHFLADLVSLPNAAVVKFQKSRWVLKKGWCKLPLVSLRRALWACATMSWDWEHNLEAIGWSPLDCQQGLLLISKSTNIFYIYFYNAGVAEILFGINLEQQLWSWQLTKQLLGRGLWNGRMGWVYLFFLAPSGALIAIPTY